MSNDFKNIEISDREKVTEIFNRIYCPSLEYNFTTLFIWNKIYKTQIMYHNDFLLCSSGKRHKSFLFPVGSWDIKTEIDFLIDYAKANSFPLHFHSISPSQKEFLEQNYPDKFEFTEDRNSGDYIYTSENLKNLTGKKLASKRNHINRFLENHPEWEYVNITSEIIPEILKMHNTWCEFSNCQHEEGLLEESCAVQRALNYFEELKLSGGAIKIKDGICAFSIGDRLNSDTFLVHIEKAFADVQGAYPMINKQFVINNCEDYRFVNREEDTGDEGLRRAKLSYQPYEILKKYIVREK